MGVERKKKRGGEGGRRRVPESLEVVPVGGGRAAGVGDGEVPAGGVAAEGVGDERGFLPGCRGGGGDPEAGGFLPGRQECGRGATGVRIGFYFLIAGRLSGKGNYRVVSFSSAISVCSLAF